MNKVFFKNIARGKDFAYAVKLLKKRGAEFNGSLWSVDSDKAESLRGNDYVQEVAQRESPTIEDIYDDMDSNPNSTY
jgi:hypothetical protein